MAEKEVLNCRTAICGKQYVVLELSGANSSRIFRKLATNTKAVFSDQNNWRPCVRVKTNKQQSAPASQMAWAEFLVIIGFVALSSLMLCACGATNEKSPDASLSIAEAAPAIKSVTSEGPTVFVEARLPKRGDDILGESINIAAAVARRIAGAIQHDATDLPPMATTLVVDYLTPESDRLGAISYKQFMRVEFAVSDLKAAQIENLESDGVLNLGTASEQIGAAWAIDRWCLRHTEKASTFCDQANIAPRFRAAEEEARKARESLEIGEALLSK